MNYLSSAEEEKYEDPWKVVEDYRRNGRLEVNLSGENSPKDKKAYRNSYHARSSSCSLGYSPSASYSNLSRFNNSNFNERFSGSRTSSVSGQSAGRTASTLPKRPSSLHCQSEDSTFSKKNLLKFNQDAASMFSSPGRTVSRSPSLHEDENVFSPKESIAAAQALPLNSPSLSARSTSQISIREFNSEAEKIKNYYGVQLKGLVEDYSKAEKRIESLEARLIQEKSQVHELRSENEVYAKKIRLKDETLDEVKKQLESMVSTVAALQGEKNQLLHKLKERDTREKEEKSVYEQRISALHSKIDTIKALHDGLQKDSESLRMERQAWNEEKTQIINQNNEDAQTISNVQKQVYDLEKSQQSLQDQIPNRGEPLSSGKLEGGIGQIIKERASAEADNRAPADRIGDISSPREKTRSFNGIRGASMDCIDPIDLSTSNLTSHHSDLTQKRRILGNQIQILEANVVKMAEAYNQVLAQKKVLEPKLHKQQEAVNTLQDEIQQLLTTKSELAKKKRELKMEVGSLESSLSKSFKAIRRRAPLSNMPSYPNSPADSQSSSYPASPSTKAKDTPALPESAGLSNILASLMPSLTFLEPKDSAELEAQRDSARRRVDELEAMVDALHKAIALLRDQIDGHKAFYSDNRQGLVLQEVDTSLDKLEDLCRLLTASTGDFTNLVQVEKRFYALQVENEALLSEVEGLKKDQQHSPAADQLREQLAQITRDKDSELAQLKKNSEAQIRRLSKDKGALLERLASDSGAYNSQLEKHNSEKIAALERELVQSRESEREASQHLTALEEEHSQLVFEYGNATQSACFFSQEIDEYRSKLEFSQEELFTLQNEITNYQHEITHLEEQLHKLSGGYSSPGSSTLASPVLRSCRPSDVHYPEELLGILEKIGELHSRQLSKIRGLLDDSSRGEIEFVFDLQLELKELDLQAALALDCKSTSRMNEYTAQSPKFVYSKPYKEMFHKCRSEAEDLRFLLDREASLKSSLVFQKQFLLTLMRCDEASQGDIFSFIPAMCFLPQVPPFPFIPHLLQSTEFNSISNYSLETLPSRSKVRRCVWAIIAIFRAKALSSDWVRASDRTDHQLTVLTNPYP